MSSTDTDHSRKNPAPRLGTPLHIITLIQRVVLVVSGTLAAVVATMAPVAANTPEIFLARIAANHTEPFLAGPRRNHTTR